MEINLYTINKKQNKMEQNNIPARVIEIIVDKLAVLPEDVTPEANIKEDLGADSLDVLELILAFEDEFSITIPDEVVESVVTVQQAIVLVEERAANKK